MGEITQIDTSKYKVTGKVKIDDMLWDVKLPGAATSLKLEKAQRKIRTLERKVKDDTITDEELDQYDALEDFAYNVMFNTFKDGTKDNSQVNKWFEETPIFVIGAVLQDLTEQANKDES